jgi:hypothetical protein
MAAHDGTHRCMDNKFCAMDLLPDEVVRHIIGLLPLKDRCKFACTGTRFDALERCTPIAELPLSVMISNPWTRVWYGPDDPKGLDPPIMWEDPDELVHELV